MGAAIAAVMQIVFYPYFIRNNLHSYVMISLRNLKKLNNEIFSCLLQPEYADNIYLYERRLHDQKNQFMHTMERLREISHLAKRKMSPEEKISHERLLMKLDLLFDNMLDYSQLRRRVTDYATLSICSQELTGISQEVDKSIDGAMARMGNKKFYPSIKMLTQKIQRLEDNYHNVLQVAAREPLVFLLFIDSLNAFSKSMEELYETLRV
jgi:hypothetical protein